MTDIDELVAINICAGAIRKKIRINGARFLTGIAADSKGVLYVGDMLTSRIIAWNTTGSTSSATTGLSSRRVPA